MLVVQVPPLKWLDCGDDSDPGWSAGRFAHHYDVHEVRKGWRCVVNPAYHQRFVLGWFDTPDEAKKAANEFEAEYIKEEITR